MTQADKQKILDFINQCQFPQTDELDILKHQLSISSIVPEELAQEPAKLKYENHRELFDKLIEKFTDEWDIEYETIASTAAVTKVIFEMPKDIVETYGQHLAGYWMTNWLKFNSDYIDYEYMDTLVRCYKKKSLQEIWESVVPIYDEDELDDEMDDE